MAACWRCARSRCGLHGHRLHLRSRHRSASSTASPRYCAVCPELHAKPFGARQGVIYGWSDRSDCGRRRARPEHVTAGAIVPSQDGGVRGGPWRVGSRWTSTSTGRPHSAEASFQDGLRRATLLKPCTIAKLRCIAPYLSMTNHTSSCFASSSRKRRLWPLATTVTSQLACTPPAAADLSQRLRRTGPSVIASSCHWHNCRSPLQCPTPSRPRD